MTDTEVPPDGIVRTALRLLPVPSHADDFWTRLDHTLDAQSVPPQPNADVPARSVFVGQAAAPLSVATPVLELEPDPTMALVPSALRRPSNALLLLVAAAAVVVVALAGSTLLDERSGTKHVTSDDVAQGAGEPAALAAGAQPGSVTPVTMSDQGEEAASEAVLAWVDDLRSGRGDEAWEAMGPTSQAHFASQAAFESDLTSLAEGFGGWSEGDPDEVLITPVLADGEGTLAVVTLVGSIKVEGEQQRRADAFPVRVVDGEAHVEPFAFAGELEVVVPEDVPSDGDRPPVASGEELVIVVPSAADAPLLRLDDGDTVVCGQAEGTELVALEGTPGQRCSYLPVEGIDPGEHTLTVAFLGSDGASISAASLLFEAA